MQEYFDRIDLNTDLSNISKIICEKYNLGNYLSDKIVEIGYEDFNYILTTSKNKYFVKILYNGRDENEANDYLERLSSVCATDISFPKLLSANGEYLFKITIENVTYRIFVFEYIDGKNLFELGTELDIDGIKFIANQINLIHQIKIEPNFIYDSWAISSFPTEYVKKKDVIPDKYKSVIEDLYNKYTNVDFDNLPHAFVHGDLMNTNVMKDANNKLWIIDFAVSNYLPRIQDLVVASCNLCMTSDKEKSYHRISILVNEYTKNNKLTDYEKKAFKILFDISNAMFLMQASYQISIGNNSKETLFWLNKGIKGLEFSDSLEFDKIFK